MNISFMNPTPIQKQTLLAAIKAGDLALYKRLTSEYGVSHCYNAPDNQIPLFVACTFGHTEIVKYLVTPDQKGIQCWYHLDGNYAVQALHQACFYGYTEVVKVLLSRMGDYSKIADKLESPYQVAMNLNRPEIAAMLVSHLKWSSCNPAGTWSFQEDDIKDKDESAKDATDKGELSTQMKGVTGSTGLIIEGKSGIRGKGKVVGKSGIRAKEKGVVSKSFHERKDGLCSFLSQEQIAKLVEVAVEAGNSKLICQLYSKGLIHCGCLRDIINYAHHKVLKWAAIEAEAYENCPSDYDKKIEPTISCLLEDAFRYYDTEIKKEPEEQDKAAFWIQALLFKIQVVGATWHFEQIVERVDEKLNALPPSILDISVNQLCGRGGYDGFEKTLAEIVKKYAGKIDSTTVKVLFGCAGSRNHPGINELAIAVLESMRG